MPATTVNATDLFRLLGRSLEAEDLRSAVLGCKAEVEGIEGEEIKLEIKDSNRIDLLSTEGIVRTLKGYLGIEVGLPSFSSTHSGIEVQIDPKVKDVRPYVVAFTARDVSLSGEVLVSCMNVQEKIHTTYGRGRQRMAIGFYDLDLIKPPVTYTVTRPDDNAFVPLGFEEEMTPAQILKDHPKGRDYAHLLRGFEVYPMLYDSEKQVLSMPPVINSNTLGRVTPGTKNLFVEATGSDFDVLSLGITVLAADLADRGGKIGAVKLVYGEGDIRTTPDFSTRTSLLDPARANGLLGLGLTTQKMVELLRKARFDARVVSGQIEVSVPPYRGDIMHQTDLVEELAIMYGYETIEPIEPKIPTVGRTNALEDFSDSLRDLMIGMGFQEILTFILTSPDNVVGRMNDRRIDYVEIENPTTLTFSIFRPDLLPSLLEFLSHNAHVAYPQKIFESGDCVEILDGECVTSRRLCLVWADSKVNFTQIKAVVQSVLGDVGVNATLSDSGDQSFIEGRAASVLVEGRMIGGFGEIHPGVLEAWQIPVPVLAAEFRVEPLRSRT